jgi:hypothetical protein
LSAARFEDGRIRRATGSTGEQRAGVQTHQRCKRKPLDVTLVVHHRDERGVAGRRALDKTNLRCRGCHQLEQGRRPLARAAKTTSPLPLSTEAAVYAPHFGPAGLPHFRGTRSVRVSLGCLSLPSTA